MKLTLTFFSAILTLLSLAFISCEKNEYRDLDCNSVNSSYAQNIQKIIGSNCLGSGCHGSGSSNGDFTDYTGLKGKANNGSLKKRVVERKDMPSANPLTLADREKLKCWIESGAPNN